jgi:outer membrane murein-binding lipoprotein Lpp
MRILVILLLASALLLTTAVSGCVSEDTIQSPQDAQQTLRNLSSDIESLEDTLAEIDESLG